MLHISCVRVCVCDFSMNFLLYLDVGYARFYVYIFPDEGKCPNVGKLKEICNRQVLLLNAIIIVKLKEEKLQYYIHMTNVKSKLD